jgi:UDP-N-acetyl-D-glucosamine dehydrogenase
LSEDSYIDGLVARYGNRTAVVAIIGLGYVGLPLVKALTDAGFKVVGFDIDAEKIAALMDGRTYIRHLPAELFSGVISRGRFLPTTDLSQLTEADAILICVPTPLTSHREPDLTFIEMTAHAIVPVLRKGQLVVLESTTYPGTTRDVIKPILEPIPKVVESDESFVIRYAAPESSTGGCRDVET